jgi:dipeptidyl aminopeptidase/acylaminoacyl peptidase
VTPSQGVAPTRRLVASAVVVLLGLAACSGSESEPPVRLDGPTSSFPGFTPPGERAPCPGALDPATFTAPKGGQAPGVEAPGVEAPGVEAPGVEAPEMPAPREVALTSSDGAEVPALVAVGANNAGIVLVHGGFGRRPEAEDLRGLAAARYTVIAPEYRTNDIGGLEVDDVAAAARFLTEERGIEPGRIALVGTSHGASIAALVAARFPEVAGALVWAAGAADWSCIWSLNEGRGLARTLERSMGMTPEDDAGFLVYAERSPLYWAHEVTVPVHLVHSQRDGAVPPGQSQLMADALRDAGVVVEWRLAFGRGHRFLDREDVRGRADWAYIVDFLRRTIGA